MIRSHIKQSIMYFSDTAAFCKQIQHIFHGFIEIFES